MDFVRVYNRVACGEPTLYGIFESSTAIIQHWCGRSWSEKTAADYFEILQTKILPAVPHYNQRPASSYTKKDFEKILADLSSHTWSDPKKAGQICRYTESELKKFDIILHAIGYGVEMLSLGENPFGVYHYNTKGRTLREESARDVRQRVVKSLSAENAVKLVRVLLKAMLSPDSVTAYGRKIPQVAFRAVLLCMLTGMRDGEAAAVLWSHYKAMDWDSRAHCLMVVQSMSSKTGQVQASGKTYNATRTLVLPHISDLILQIMRMQTELEIWTMREKERPASIEQLPIAGVRKGKGFDYCSVDLITLAANFALEKIGIRKPELELVARRQWAQSQRYLDAGDVDAYEAVDKNPSAYLMRHFYATAIWQVGYSEPELRYSMGHKMPEELISRRDFTDEALLRQMYVKLSKFPLFCRTPEVVKHEVEEEQEILISGSQSHEIRIPLKPGTRVLVHLESAAPQSALHVKRRYSFQAGSGQEFFSETEVPMHGTLTAGGEIFTAASTTPLRVDMMQMTRRAYHGAGVDQLLDEIEPSYERMRRNRPYRD